MKRNYKPINPAVRCPGCGRLVATRRGRLVPHHPQPAAPARSPLCPQSLKRSGGADPTTGS